MWSTRFYGQWGRGIAPLAIRTIVYKHISKSHPRTNSNYSTGFVKVPFTVMTIEIVYYNFCSLVFKICWICKIKWDIMWCILLLRGFLDYLLQTLYSHIFHVVSLVPTSFLLSLDGCCPCFCVSLLEHI